MSELILKEIIKLKNQKEVYLIENAEGVFCTVKRDTKILSETWMSKKSMFKNSETESNLQCKVKFVEKFLFKV